jgi:hypothetical protein
MTYYIKVSRGFGREKFNAFSLGSGQILQMFHFTMHTHIQVACVIQNATLSKITPAVNIESRETLQFPHLAWCGKQCWVHD